MIAPKKPTNELLRQKEVEKYGLLDTLPEESYDTITSIMSYICEVPISLVTLLDKERNFLKSHHGIPLSESPRELSFCGHAINSEELIFTIEDARKDARFLDNPIVEEHGVVFYAGVPLVNPNGFKLGTLCVYDTKPRKLRPDQETALKQMAKQVITLFEERVKNSELEKLQKLLKDRNSSLEKFAGVISHDLKSPLAQITSLTQLIAEEVGQDLSEDAQQYFEYIQISSKSLRDYIDGILIFYKTDEVTDHKSEVFNFDRFGKDLQNIYAANGKVSIIFSSEIEKICVNKAVLMQILGNLISNADKHNDKAKALIRITAKEYEDSYTFCVIDNGAGIPKQHLDSIFDLFSTVNKTDQYGDISTGIGLATVKKMVHNLGGKISVTSEVGAGSTFTFSIAK